MARNRVNYDMPLPPLPAGRIGDHSASLGEPVLQKNMEALILDDLDTSARRADAD